MGGTDTVSDCTNETTATGAVVSADNAIGVAIEIVAACICIIGMNTMKGTREKWERRRARRADPAALPPGSPGACDEGVQDPRAAPAPHAAAAAAAGSSDPEDGGRADTPVSCEEVDDDQECWPTYPGKYIFYRPWLGALVLYAVGEGLQVFALSWGDASVIQSVSMLALVLNVFIARFYFKEQVPQAAMWATAVVIVGAGMACFGGITPPCLDLTVFQRHIKRMVAVFAFCILGGVLGAMLLLLYVFADLPFVRHNISLVYAVLASALGSFSFFSGNIFSKLGKAAVREGTGWGSLLLSGAFFICVALCELIVLNRGLARCESSVFIPTYYVLITLFLLLANTAFFSEEAQDQYQEREYKIPLFAAGILLILVGVYFLGRMEGQNKYRRLSSCPPPEPPEKPEPATRVPSTGASRVYAAPVAASKDAALAE
eukprot:TRINITY_DN14218_c0_g1_i1.p1 TRINITY_DN14218_c0_g1~~TRINITY_DN14218_c0_g1_i1.p1  ORF type:complete len:463 (+),score=116.46 TRINITY_DN14218_c0_g1_i1:94-1389(+)